MEQNPDLSGTEVTERPKGSTLDAEVIAVVKGERGEIYDGLKAENLKHGSIEDEMLQVQVEVEYQGRTIPVYLDMRFYDNPSDRSTFGKYVERYGVPEVGQEIAVNFDSEGNARWAWKAD